MDHKSRLPNRKDEKGAGRESPPMAGSGQQPGFPGLWEGGKGAAPAWTEDSSPREVRDWTTVSKMHSFWFQTRFFYLFF